MLGAIICALVGVPLQFLGVVRDGVNKLSGKDGGDWYEKLRLILREPVVAEVTLQTLTVPANLSIADRIALGNYDWVNSDITEQNFPHDPTSVGEWEYKLLHFGRECSFEDAVAVTEVDGWIVGKPDHLLAFGEKYPDEQHKYTIVALGSWCVLGGNRYVLRLWGDDSERFVELYDWYGERCGGFRFLAVRRKV